MPWNALDTHVPAFITLVDCIRYTFVLRGRPMSTQTRTHTHTHIYIRMRIRNDTQSKRDSRVNEKVNNRCVFARSHLQPRSAEAIRDTPGHWEPRTERKRGTGFARWNIQDRKPLGKSREIATHGRRECRNWEINAIAANSCKGEWIMADNRSYEWAKTSRKLRALFGIGKIMEVYD